MLETTNEVLDAAAANEIVISRVFAAPRAMVWGALADPWQVGQWWGPKGFTTDILEMDLRTGGKWRLIMHGPDGTKYPNEMTFTEVVRMQLIRLELTGCREGAPLIHFQQSMTFTDEDGGTRFTVRISFATAEDRDQNVRDYGSIEGCKQMMERLNAHLQERKSPPSTWSSARSPATVGASASAAAAPAPTSPPKSGRAASYARAFRPSDWSTPTPGKTAPA